jgi:nucleoside-diphosphate-sugar epimerase
MRILLLGGTGFIGSQVAELLLLAGHQIGVVHRGRVTVPAGCSSLVADRTAPAALGAALSEFAPETLIDMIAYAAVDADRLMAVLPRELDRLVIISSGDVYASYGAFLGHEPPPPVSGPLSETGPLRVSRFPYRAQATSANDLRYDYDKILVEERFRDRAKVPVTVLRLPMVYGAGDPHHRVAADIHRLRAGAGILRLHPTEAAWRCTRGYVSDVAAAVALAATHPGALGQTYNVGELEAWTQQQWLTALAQALDLPVAIHPDPEALPSLPARWTVSLAVSTERIRRDLGFVEPVGSTEGLRRSVLTTP